MSAQHQAELSVEHAQSLTKKFMLRYCLGQADGLSFGEWVLRKFFPNFLRSNESMFEALRDAQRTSDASTLLQDAFAKGIISDEQALAALRAA